MSPTMNTVVRAPAPMWPAGNKFADLNKRAVLPETDGLLSRDVPEMNIRSDDDLLAERDDAFTELLEARDEAPASPNKTSPDTAAQKNGYYPPNNGYGGNNGYGNGYGNNGEPIIFYNAAGRQGATKAGFAIAFVMVAAALF